MSRELSAESRKTIEDFVRKIADRHELGDEVHEELVCHFEDRVLEILNSEESLSEKDALLHVQEHFGNAGEIKELLHGVHATLSTLSFARRVLLIVAATLFIYSGLSVLLNIGALAILYTLPEDIHHHAYRAFMLFSGGPLLVLLLWRQTYRWRKSLTTGQSHWVATTSLRRLKYLVLLSGVTVWLVPRPGGFPRVAQPIASDAIETFVLFTLVLSYVCMCWIWVRWCDTPPHSFGRMLAGGLAWLMLLFAFAIIPQGTILQFSLSNGPLMLPGREIATSGLSGTDYVANWYILLPTDWLVVSLLRSLGTPLAAGLMLILLFYVTVLRRWFLRD